ncbi:MAG TPA: ABC transporter permease [Candidatus Acidoferrum sp.]|nr:ABC transporter permease [Candidatus Acidoferrum sp.]
MTELLAGMGRRAFLFREDLAAGGRLMIQVAARLASAPFTAKGFRWPATFRQMVRIGVESLPIVFLIAGSVGVIVALQAAMQLRRVGATIYVADLVGVSLTRELGPLMTAIIIAGRSGSAIAAELGTMKVSEEVDALTAMGLDPVEFLALPRILAMGIMLPCLTTLADVVGILGGVVVAWVSLDIPPENYLNQTFHALLLKDIFSGLIKSWVFAAIIAGVGCYQGFRVEGGAEGVGRRTTASVVASIFLIIAADLLFTLVFYMLG